MKKIVKLIAVFAAAAAVFTSCDKAETDPVYPTITKVSIEESGDNFVGIFNVVCNSDYQLDEATAKYTYGSTTVSVPSANISKFEDTNNPKSSWKLEVTVPKTVADAAVTKIIIAANVKKHESKETGYETPSQSIPETDLEAAAALTFKRIGGANGTGLDAFGLKWTENKTKAIWAYIVKDSASKMVQLTTANWTDLKTVEALEAAIEAGTDMSEYKGVSADKNDSYNDVLGVKNGDVYYMINITSATVEANTAGTTIEIKGEYKK